MGLTCNADAYSRTLQSQPEFRYVFNAKLSETEQQLTERYHNTRIAGQEENNQPRGGLRLEAESGSGEKMALGFWQGSSENHEIWKRCSPIWSAGL
jgi:hypothetical protein